MMFVIQDMLIYEVKIVGEEIYVCINFDFLQMEVDMVVIED